MINLHAVSYQFCLSTCAITLIQKTIAKCLWTNNWQTL